MKTNGFAFMEFLVVIVIVGVLATILAPAIVSSIKDSGKTSKSQYYKETYNGHIYIVRKPYVGAGPHTESFTHDPDCSCNASSNQTPEKE